MYSKKVYRLFSSTSSNLKSRIGKNTLQKCCEEDCCVCLPDGIIVLWKKGFVLFMYSLVFLIFLFLFPLLIPVSG